MNNLGRDLSVFFAILLVFTGCAQLNQVMEKSILEPNRRVDVALIDPIDDKRTFAKPLGWLRARRQSKGVETETIEFDELDMAVLKLAVEQPKGRVISAVELSEHIPVRPSQLQESLKRLRAFRLLDPAMGTTEGYENYRLTPAGVRFVEQIS